MKKALAFILLVGCGDGLSDNDLGCGCKIYDESYSHTIVFCGGTEPENAVRAFSACNVRKPRSEQYEGCVPNVDLMELEPDCEMRHICSED